MLPVLGKLTQVSGLLLLAGVPLFWWFVWRPAAGQTGGQDLGVAEDERAFHRLLSRVTGMGFLLIIIGIGLDLARIVSPLAGGLPLDEQMDFAISFLRATGTGRALLFRLPMALGFLLTCAWALRVSGGERAGEQSRFKGSLPAVAFVVLGGLLCWTTALSGHAVTSPAPQVTVLSDWVHLCTAVVWGGALVGFALLPWTGLAVRRGGLMTWLSVYRRALSRLSTIGLAAVLTLTITGIMLTGAHVSGTAAAVQSVYGRSLFAKLLLVGVLIGIAAVNRFRWLPLLAKTADSSEVHEDSQGEGGAGSAPLPVLSRLRSFLRIEAVLFVLVITTTALLTQTPPPTTPGRLTEAHSWTGTTGPWLVEARIEPREANWVAIRLHVSDRVEGEPVELQEVVLQLDMPGHAMAMSPLRASPIGAGVYEVSAPVVMAGPWEADVYMAGGGQEGRVLISFDLPEAPLDARSALQLLLMGRWLGVIQVVVALGAAAVGVWLIVSWLPLARKRGTSGGVTSGAFFLAGGILWLLFMTIAPTTYWPNPTDGVAFDERLAAEARPLYETHCAACHGLGGRGDGPLGSGLRTRPADFAVHVTHHTEGEFFWMITNGLPGTDMPPFQSVLSEEERWLLARYVQELGRTALRQLRER